jgi:hypothetical protein
MLKMLKKPHLKPYHEVLSRFNLDTKLQAMLLSMIYPLDRFIDDDGMGNAGARFKQRLGLGKVEESSGDKKGSKAGGSAVFRKLLYIHVYHSYTADNPTSWAKETDLVLSYYRHLTDRWNSDPKAIALRERNLASKKAAAVEKELKGLVDKEIIKKLKQAVIANVESDCELKTNELSYLYKCWLCCHPNLSTDPHLWHNQTRTHQQPQRQIPCIGNPGRTGSFSCTTSRDTHCFIILWQR